MEWDTPAVVLAARPYGEGDALATVLTEPHGAHRGLARGGLSRTRASLWQPGNVVQARWVARLSDQLGSITAELVHPGAALGLTVSGPTAGPAGPTDDNLVLRAARGLAARVPNLRLGAFHLVKRLPVAAGIGGGSADAGALLAWIAARHPALGRLLSERCVALGAGQTLEEKVLRGALQAA